jgi:DNA modification methylase
VACKNINRKSIGIEKEKKYFDITVERLKEENIKEK